MNLFLAFFLAGAVGASAQMPAASLTRIGAAAAVKGLVNAMAPGTTVGRVVESGKPLFLNDHVTTDAAGRLQVLLLDETVFTMGPNSDMVLDEFVYDPATNAGKVTARVTKGVFRFVTGKVARKDPASMKVNLPVGTIGIRGTIAAGQVSEQDATVILLGPGSQNNANENPGAVSVSNSGGQVALTQPGFGTTLALGFPPTPPANMFLQLQSILGALGGPLPSGSQSSAAGGEASATQASGQGTAAGGALANASGDILNFTNAANAAQQAAAQTGNSIADSLSTWDQVRSIQTGSGFYSGIGDYFCQGGTCYTGANVPGGLTFHLDVDFGARTYGNVSTSLISLSGPLGDSASIAPTSFSGLPGNAVITINNPINTQFNNTTISLMNQGGVAARNATLILQYATYNSGNISATGAVTGPFHSGPN